MVKFLALVLLQSHLFSVSYAASVTMILIGPNFTPSSHLADADETTVEFGVFKMAETGMVYVAEPLQDCSNLMIPISKDWFGLCEKIEIGARREKMGNSFFVTKATAETLKQYTCVGGVKVLFVDRYIREVYVAEDHHGGYPLRYYIVLVTR